MVPNHKLFQMALHHQTQTRKTKLPYHDAMMLMSLEKLVKETSHTFAKVKRTIDFCTERWTVPSGSVKDCSLKTVDRSQKIFLVCGRRFTDRSNCIKHQFIHTGLKPFECPHCGKRFRRKDHLNSHR